jgi:hypothetical protein
VASDILAAAEAAQRRGTAPLQKRLIRTARLELVWWGKLLGINLVGKQTANGEILDMVTATAARRSLPLPSYAKVTNFNNGCSVVAKIHDRGSLHSRSAGRQ